MLFAVDQLIPTYSCFIDFQTAVVKAACNNDDIAELAVIGLNKSSPKFYAAIDRLWELCESPAAFIPLPEMIDCVDDVERNYASLYKRLKMLAESNQLDLTSDKFAGVRGEWEQTHQALVAAYEPLKRDSRFGTKIFRPGRESRWSDF